MTRKWRNIAEMYKHFAKDWNHVCDFSEKAAEEMFIHESTGKGSLSVSTKRDNGLYNGYMVGKHWMDATIKMWKQDLPKGLLFITELRDAYPMWWLRKVLPGYF